MTKDKREALRMMFGGKCAYCGCDLPEKGWHADHVEPVLREWWKNKAWREGRKQVFEWNQGLRAMVARPATDEELKAGFIHPERDVDGNLFPSCRACNIDKHASSLESWRRQMQDRVGVCRRNYSAFRHAERFGLVQEIVKPVVFWFEKYGAENDASQSLTGEVTPSQK